jgi:hypothetical protein
MANAIFDIARRKFALGELMWSNGAPGTWNVALMDLTRAANGGLDVTMSSSGVLATATSLTPLSSVTTNAGSSNFRSVEPLAGMAVADNGACSANSVTFMSVASTPADSAAGLLIFYQPPATTSSADAIPVLWIDAATGLPIVPNGGNIIVTWDTGVNKIFRL